MLFRSVYLTAGLTYSFEFNRFGADTKLLLFRNPASSTYWVGRSGRVLETTGLLATYTAPATDWYGIVVVNDDFSRELGTRFGFTGV